MHVKLKTRIITQACQSGKDYFLEIRLKNIYFVEIIMQKRITYLRCHVTKSSCLTRHVIWILCLDASNTKVSNLHGSCLIKKHVFRLHISVHNFLWVKITQPAQYILSTSTTRVLIVAGIKGYELLIDVDKADADPLARSRASWTTTLKASFFLRFFIRYVFSAPPARYSTTTQQTLVGIPRRPFSVWIVRPVAPIVAPINCKESFCIRKCYREDSAG